MDYRRLLPIVLILPLFMLIGCATPIDSGRISAMRQVGVVSVIGDDVQVQQIGTTVFGNRNETESFPEFRADAVATEAMLQTLKPRFPNVTALSSADRNMLAEIEQKPDTFVNRLVSGPPPLWDPQNREIAGRIQQIGRSRNVDTIVVTYPLLTTNQYLPIPIRGIGIGSVNKFGMRRLGTFANISVAVFDGRTGELIGTNAGVYETTGDLDIRFQETMAEYSPSEREQFRGRIQSQIREKVVSALNGVGMGSGPSR